MGSKLASMTVGLGLGSLAILWAGCGSDEEPLTISEDGGSQSAEAAAPNEDGSTTPNDGSTTPNEDASTTPNDASTTPNDAGTTPNDAGTTPTDASVADGAVVPQTISLRYGGCTALTACGGDETGTWTATSGCFDDGFMATVQKECPNLTTSNQKATGRGYVRADGAKLTVDLTTTVTVDAFIPYACAPIKSCFAVSYGLTSTYGFDKASCKENVAKTGCNCALEETQRSAETAVAYTKSGGTLTTAKSAYDYCVSAGPKLGFVDTKAAYLVTYDLTR